MYHFVTIASCFCQEFAAEDRRADSTDDNTDNDTDRCELEAAATAHADHIQQQHQQHSYSEVSASGTAQPFQSQGLRRVVPDIDLDNVVVHQVCGCMHNSHIQAYVHASYVNLHVICAKHVYMCVGLCDCVCRHDMHTTAYSYQQWVRSSVKYTDSVLTTTAVTAMPVP